MSERTLAIVNPHGGNGRASRRWPGLERQLRESIGDLEVVFTDRPRAAEKIAADAARDGFERLIVGGGDGTTSEVVTGLVEAGQSDRVAVGLLPLGSGCDVARTLGLPSDVGEVATLLASGERRKVDAGRIRYRDHRGEPRESCFLNVASFGLSGLTDELVNRAGKSMGPTLAFAFGTLRAIASYRPPEIAIDVDGREVYRGRLALAAVANGRYFGSGMAVAPEALPDDGLLDVVIVGDMSKARLVANFPRIYLGTHLGHPCVSSFRGTRVEARALEGRAPIDVDGEPLGDLPVTIEIIPKAIELFGVPLPPGR